jgi:hypothetical protein
MNTGKHSLTSSFGSALLRSSALVPLCLLSLSTQGFAQAEERGDVPNPIGPEAFLRVAAERLAVAAEGLSLERIEGPLVLPETGLELWVASAVHGAEKLVLALDAEGRLHDLERARELETAAAYLRRGKLGQALWEHLQENPSAPVLVSLWLDVEGVEDARLAEAEAVAALEEAGLADEVAMDERIAAISAGVRARVEPATRALGAELAARGFEVLHADGSAPILVLRAHAGRLAELSSDPRVLLLDSAEGEYAPRLSNAFKEVRADKVYSTYPSANADYAKVAIVESGKPCEGPWLDVVEYRADGAFSAHTTGVASCVASSHPTHKGIAKGAKIYAANGATMVPGSVDSLGFGGSVAAIDWAIAKGCQIMNLSYGAAAPTATVTAFDKYLDYVARTNAKVLAIACGNSGAYAGDPGAGYNQIAVGNFTDQNDYDWTGETMAASSSWQNPSTGVETPQLAAPGTSLTMLDCASGTTYAASGTSFSSPIAAGAAGLVIDRQPALATWPEAVRAILMATAWHNIEGATKLSSKDGAGGLDAYAAYRVAGRGKGPGYQYGVLSAASFDASGLYTAQSVFVTAGTKVRATLSWDSQVTKSGLPFLPFISTFASVLASDLDFYAYSPTGALHTTSSSALQPFEMLEFTAPVTGTYTFKVKKYSFGSGSEYFGTAVSFITDKGE